MNTEVDGDRLIIQPLGAGREVGRSCIYMSYKGKVILFDCGVLPEFGWLVVSDGIVESEREHCRI